MTLRRQKKILFVTHALDGLYGAATSLRLLLQNYSGIEADMLLPRSFRHPRDMNKTLAGLPLVRHAHELSLPVDLGLLGISRSPAEIAHGAAHWLGWQRDRAAYHRLLERENYDIVHFNSPVLHRMILPGIPAVTHIRDIIIDPQSAVIDRLANATGLVFIDAATRKPFARREGGMHAVTLNNPFDMRDVPQAPPLRNTTFDATRTIFSMIGRVSELKGVKLVIEAFRQGAAADSVLLIVGSGPHSYMAQCLAAADTDPRILFWGEEENIKGVYALTDYVVRGDPQPCVGRTVYEGLYAGCRIIMPGPGQPDMVFEADRFTKSIHWYKPGDRNALAEVFSTSGGEKTAARQYLSNIEGYVEAFDAFIDSCLACGKAQTR